MSRSNLLVRWPRPVLAALLLCAAIPTGASADVAIDCLNAYGTRAPTTWCADAFTDVLMPTGQPYRATWPQGTLFVRGVASEKVQLRIAVSDEDSTIEQFVDPQNVDSGQGRPDGGFSATFPAFRLGAHAVEEAADPNHNAGASTLAIAIYIPDEEEPIYETTITKMAGTARDLYKPILSKIKWPPTTWCHTSVGGVCGATAREDVRVQGQEIRNFPVPTGQAVVSGQTTDDPFTSYGRSSDIADIVMTIKQGSRIIREPFSVLNRITGVSAAWNVILKVEDFAPNYYPGWDKYTVHVSVRDAWGNTTETTSPGFTVYDI